MSDLIEHHVVYTKQAGLVYEWPDSLSTFTQLPLKHTYCFTFLSIYPWCVWCVWCVAVEALGGQCLPCVVDIREEEQLKAAVDQAVAKFGGIDILVNNASAINITGTVETSMKKDVRTWCICPRGVYVPYLMWCNYSLASRNLHNIISLLLWIN